MKEIEAVVDNDYGIGNRVVAKWFRNGIFKIIVGTIASRTFPISPYRPNYTLKFLNNYTDTTATFDHDDILGEVYHVDKPK